MRFDPQLAQAGTKRVIKAGDFEQTTLKSGNEVTVYAEQVKQDKVLWHGHGNMNRTTGNVAHIYAALVASGNGSGTAGDAIEGELVAAITDSDQRRVLASTTIDDLGELADAEASERTERPMHPALEPFAKPGRHLELRILAAPESDGVEVDPANSNARLYYSEA
ncbi:hypothetical protein [Halomarina oriensis]|uniref:Uncharacterized protein n=1 Tax=Halomarina oriensis TaxID=671145 RepID=A0A6B0GL38_9EURY|nr:hypothetical protein [Halomarina oriensis]MWG34159.1 hypothetical protein [Halomarina oriensis]